MTKTSLKVQNIVATTSLGKPIPLTKLARTQSNTEYNPEQFPGLVLRVKKPKSVQQVKEVVNQVIKQLKRINIKITDKPRINVQNIVASGSIDMTLNLNLLALQLENTEYEPEQFPGLVGKLVCTGTKNRQQLEESMRQLIKNTKAAVKAMKK